MDLDSIKITPQSFEDICKIMDLNYGDVNWQSFKSSDEFMMYCATLIQASYKIGFRDAQK
jgi:hypothetical protein